MYVCTRYFRLGIWELLLSSPQRRSVGSFVAAIEAGMGDGGAFQSHPDSLPHIRYRPLDGLW